MRIVLLNGLWLIPLGVFLLAWKVTTSWLWRTTGLAFGSVVSPASIGLYGLFYLHPWLYPLGMLGLLSAMIHEQPGSLLIMYWKGMRSAAIGSGGLQLEIEIVNGLIWSLVYGGMGYLLDRLRRDSTV